MNFEKIKTVQSEHFFKKGSWKSFGCSGGSTEDMSPMLKKNRSLSGTLLNTI
jgi:hypothetical protein